MAANCDEYANPTTPVGKDAVLICSAGLISKLRLAVALLGCESVTVTDMVALPAAWGVPVSAPDVLKLNPAGSPVDVHE